MNQRIREIFEKLKSLLADLESVHRFLQRQDFYRANNLLRDCMPVLEEALVRILQEPEYFGGAQVSTEKESILGLLNSLLDALERKEYVLLADVIRQLVLPFLYAVQEHIVARELAQPLPFGTGERSYFVEYTSCGLPTVRVGDGGQEFYLHSNCSARQEAEELADGWLEAEKEEYIIYGMGLGYAVSALLQKNEYASVRVYESDEELLKLAEQYGVLGELQRSGRVEAVPDEKGLGFLSAVRENPDAAVCFFYPSLRLIRDRAAAERMEELFISRMSQKGQYPAMYGNFRRNTVHYDGLAEELADRIAGRRVFLVAGGPSLDRNYSLLGRAQETGTVIVVGTVLRKLLAAGIRPDFVIVTDAKANTWSQLEGLEDAGVPMIGLSTAYHRFFTDYHARHYLLCQEDFAPAEQFAAQKGTMLIRTGGSVITAALSLAVALRAAEIVFLGLDLAYTGGRGHAGDADDYLADVGKSGQRTVRDIYGNETPTGKNLEIYRKFIEREIAGAKQIRFVDATEGGARIQGTELLTLEQVLAEDAPGRGMRT